jgi:citrate synthase
MKPKVSIIGAGMTGSTAAHWLAEKEICDLVLVDIVEGMPQGKALDLQEAMPIVGLDVSIKGTNDYVDTAGSDIIVITAGVARKPGMSRDDLLAINSKIVGEATTKTIENSPNAIYLILTNPLDAMCYIAQKAGDIPRERIIGQAGVLDSARMQAFVAMETGVSVENINCYVLGGHGDTMVPLVRHSNIAGIPLNEILEKDRLEAIVERTRKGGGEIVSLLKNGSAYYAPAAAITQMVEAILKDKHLVVPSSVLLEGEYGQEGIFFGVPAELGREGLVKVIEYELNEEEFETINQSAKHVKANIVKLKELGLIPGSVPRKKKSLASLSVTDNRTGKSYELPIVNDTIRALDLRTIKMEEADFGMMSFDPGFKNTATTESTITNVVGEEGVLQYRGYPIEQLAKSSDAMETAYLLIFGKLPSQEELIDWRSKILMSTHLPEDFMTYLEALSKDTHPMSAFISNIAYLETFYDDAKDIGDKEGQLEQVKKIIAKVPLMAAFFYRHSQGLPFVGPDPKLSFAGNFLRTLFADADGHYDLNPAFEQALDILFILHMDHEQNASTNAMRSIGSSRGTPYSALAGAAAALYGPLHGGANEAALKMLKEIGTVENVPAYIEEVKEGKKKLMGFGHRVYKNYDPRAKVIKEHVDEVLKAVGENPILDVAKALEEAALEDEYFIKRKLYPNVDFYSGIIYEALGIPEKMMTVMFAIPRTVGWLAQWMELLEDPEQKIARPRQVYVGEGKRDYVPVTKRK